MREATSGRLGLSRRAMLTLGLGGLGAALGGGGGLMYARRRVNSVQRFPPESLRRLRTDESNPLFEAYPTLADRIPWRPLGRFPTPIEEMASPAGVAGARLFVKRDDLSSALYGGNKVRKLEFFLAEAQLASRRTLITLGGIGSNHALAAAAHGSALGFEIDLALYDQPVTPFVCRNLGGFLDSGARLHYARTIANAFVTTRRLFSKRSREGQAPYFIMVGGTSRLGCLGHVNAGLELGQQVSRNLVPEPDRLFIPLGTCGTAAGLIVGLKLAGLGTRVTAVRVAEAFAANVFVLRHIAQDAADFLHAADPSVPRILIDDSDFEVLPEYLGPGYGHPTAGAEAAVRLAAPQLTLETTYTGKALAACLDFCRRSRDPSTVLFWNTYNSAPVPPPGSWTGLPASLRHIADT